MKTLACAAIVTLSGWAAAQQANPRYELAWRLRELDREWAKHNTPQERAKALPRIEDAMQLWLSGDLRAAAEAIDDARTKLDGELVVRVNAQGQLVDDVGASVDAKREVGAAIKRDAMRFAVTPATRLCDSSESSVALLTEAFYGGERDITCGMGLDLFEEVGNRAHPLALGGRGDGDHSLSFPLRRNHPAQRPVAISIVSNRDARLAALEKAIVGLPQRAPRIESETAQESLALLQSLAAGASNTFDYPATRLLAETEQVVAVAANGESWYGPQHPGEFWLALSWLGSSSTETSRAHLRVFVPSGLTPEKPRPLVLALHGEGGDENSMFERGDGAIARMCRERNWILVAPRLVVGEHCDLSHMLAQFAETFPFDFTRIFLLGYSSGAITGSTLFEESSGWFNGFAAIGGGRGVRAESLVNRNVFCAAGERDYGRFGVERLHQTLTAAGSQVATLKIYPNCEHLMVLADALPDVFTWFDKLAE